MPKWVKAFVTSEAYKAEIVKDVLENNDLDAVLMNKKDFVTHRGYYEVVVSADELMRALKIIDDEIEFK